jgi:hypothetical protein
MLKRDGDDWRGGRKKDPFFVGLRLVGMDFEPGGWKTVGGPLVDWCCRAVP